MSRQSAGATSVPRRYLASPRGSVRLSMDSRPAGRDVAPLKNDQRDRQQNQHVTPQDRDRPPLGRGAGVDRVRQRAVVAEQTVDVDNQQALADPVAKPAERDQEGKEHALQDGAADADRDAA